MNIGMATLGLSKCAVVNPGSLQYELYSEGRYAELTISRNTPGNWVFEDLKLLKL